MVDSARFKLRSTRLGIDSYRRRNATSTHKTAPILPTPDNPPRVSALHIPPRIEVRSLHLPPRIYTEWHEYPRDTPTWVTLYTQRRAFARNTDVSFVSKSVSRSASSLSSLSSGRAGRLMTREPLRIPACTANVMLI